MGEGGNTKVIELILELQITANNWELSQLNSEPQTFPYTVLTVVLFYLYLPFCAVAYISFCYYWSVCFSHLTYATQHSVLSSLLFSSASSHKTWRFCSYVEVHISRNQQEHWVPESMLQRPVDLGVFVHSSLPSQLENRFGRRMWCVDAEVDSVYIWHISASVVSLMNR